jgi:hypothetical protein
MADHAAMSVRIRLTGETSASGLRLDLQARIGCSKGLPSRSGFVNVLEMLESFLPDV